MRAAIPTELLLRLVNATPEEYAAVAKILGVSAECGMRNAECSTPHQTLSPLSRGTPHPVCGSPHPQPLSHLLGEGGVGFSPIEAERESPASDVDARRLFALLKALESEGNYRKAPVTRVFQLYCLEGLTRNKVAAKCHCVPSLVTLRLQAIEAKLGRKAAELRQLSGHFERIAESLTDGRARRIHRASALDEPGEEED